MDTKEHIKRSLSIADVASLYVRLKPSGKNFKALCPFHSEKTPSFSIMPERNIFHCFGCHKSGDIFTLVQEMEGLSFPEAMDFLIERFNLQIERRPGKSDAQRPAMDAFLAINEAALRHFRTNLVEGGEESEGARRYLADRGITDASVEAFSLGYAPNNWDSLLRHLGREGLDQNKALELGLLVRGREGRVYDRFRGRIIFPILSESGRVIAFGGRTMFDDPAKYLNSPESPLFYKSRNLYGFHQARGHIRETGKAVLVEGYFDVISLHQYGVGYAVAALGTALSAEQVHLLNRFTDDILLFYDGDEAGVNAALRGVECLLANNVSPRVMDCGGGVDPDDFVRANGPRGVEERVMGAEDGFRFLVNRAMEEMDPRRPEHKRIALEKVLRVVDEIADPIVRREYLQRTADAFQVDRNHLTGRRAGTSSREPETRREPLLVSASEREFLQSLLARPEFLDEVLPLLKDEMVHALTSRNIVRNLMQRYNKSARDFQEMDGIWKELSEPEASLLQELMLSAQGLELDHQSHCQRLRGCFLSFQEKLNKQRIKEINTRIRVAERENNSQEILRLMKQKANYIQQKYKVSKEEPFDQKGARESVR